MSAPAPLPASVDLWNRLNDIGGDDGVQLDRAIWQLRKLAGRQSSDFLTRLGLASALLMRGHRGEALPHVDAAYGLRHGQGWTYSFNLAFVLLECGRLQEAGELLAQLLDLPEAAGNADLYAVAMGFALRTGDVALLKRALHATRVQHEEGADFVALLERDGLVDAFRRHQEIVESLLGPVTCTFRASIDYDDEGFLSADVAYHTELEGRARLGMYRPLAEATMGPDLVDVSLRIAVGIWGPQVQAVEDAA